MPDCSDIEAKYLAIVPRVRRLCRSPGETRRMIEMVSEIHARQQARRGRFTARQNAGEPAG
jgi:hypothetical protein